MKTFKNKSLTFLPNRNATSRAGSRNTKKFYKKINSLSGFQKEISIKFLEILNIVKLYHWKTLSYATHKATDDLYSKLDGNIDKFIEILLGKNGSRIDFKNKVYLKLKIITSPEEIKREIEVFKNYLVNLNNIGFMKVMSNSDLYNIRDEILGDLNQFLYLLTLK